MSETGLEPTNAEANLIFRSEEWDIVHQTLSANRAGTMLKGFKVCERPVPVLCRCRSFFSRKV